MRLGKARTECNGAAATVRRRLESPQAREHPAEVLMGAGKVRLYAQCLLTAHQRILEAAALQPQLTEIVVCLGEFRIGIESTPVAGRGLIEPPEAPVCIAEVQVGASIFGGTLHRHSQGRQRVLAL